ncbi:hypothetical protein ADUPG1_014035 [Aduncisulcus paluster]|uniref:RRM domain-containing protein n=1 Tax=Aduncisulcus paluster TaxID=2918883 RepID=A0ABQ5K8A1_9EUKA|nr:hypothetical protein ADUPG1_014035 [Aduncisulcus paluster]
MYPWVPKHSHHGQSPHYMPYPYSQSVNGYYSAPAPAYQWPYAAVPGRSYHPPPPSYSFTPAPSTRSWSERHLRMMPIGASYRGDHLPAMSDVGTHAIAIRCPGLKKIALHQIVKMLFGSVPGVNCAGGTAECHITELPWVDLMISETDASLIGQTKLAEKTPYTEPSMFIRCSCGGCGLPPNSVSAIIPHYLADDILIICFQSQAYAAKAYDWFSTHIRSNRILYPVPREITPLHEPPSFSTEDRIDPSDPFHIPPAISASSPTTSTSLLSYVNIPVDIGEVFYVLPMTHDDKKCAVSVPLPTGTVPDPTNGRVIFRAQTRSCRDAFCLSNMGRLVLFQCDQALSRTMLCTALEKYDVKAVREPSHDRQTRSVFVEFEDRRGLVKCLLDLNSPHRGVDSTASTIGPHIKGVDFGHPGGKLTQCIITLPPVAPRSPPYYDKWLFPVVHPQIGDYDLSSEQIVRDRSLHLQKVLKKETLPTISNVYSPLHAQWIEGCFHSEEDFYYVVGK